MTSSGVVHVLLVVAIVGYVIGRQLMGEELRGKRVVVLPAVLAVVGVVDLGHLPQRAQPLDVALLAVSAVVALAIGLGQGAMMRLESRGGHLWGQMPWRSLWLWGGLVVSRLAITGIAYAAHAHVAASANSALLVLGANRLAQAGVIVLRARAMGVAFAPEKDGESFLGSFMASGTPMTTPDVTWERHPRRDRRRR